MNIICYPASIFNVLPRVVSARAEFLELIEKLLEVCVSAELNLGHICQDSSVGRAED